MEYDDAIILTERSVADGGAGLLPEARVLPPAEALKEQVRRQYTRAASGGHDAAALAAKVEGLLALGYRAADLETIPEETIVHTYPCGNPIDRASFAADDFVVDIGSGAGLDCLVVSNRLGPGGRIVGIDMTPAMVEAARVNARRAGRTNVAFRVAEAEELPFEDESVDWILSNGVICLAPDKRRVFREAFRVLRPGGRLSISDFLFSRWRPLRELSLRLSGINASLTEEEYLAMLTASGFAEARIEARETYDIDLAARLWGVRPVVGRLARCGRLPLLRPFANRLLRAIAVIHVTATKPAG